MLSGVLRGKRAVEVNISIMRAFVRLRELLASNEELARKVAQHDRQNAVLFDHVKKCLRPCRSKRIPSAASFIQRIEGIDPPEMSSGVTGRDGFPTHL